MPTYQEIVATADAQIAAQQALEGSLSAEIDRIRDKQFNGPLSAADQAELQRLRDAKTAVLATIEALALITIQDLDRAPEVQTMKSEIAQARGVLQTRLDEINHIASVAGTVAAIMGGLSEVQGHLAAL